jgi:hypothetical protein
MDEFFEYIGTTNLFDGVEDKEYIHSVYVRFMDLIPILQQLKQYQ